MKEGGIYGIVGPEGAGKSLVMTWLLLHHRAQGFPVFTFPGYYLQSADGSQLWSEELDVTEFIAPEKLPPHSSIGIDEAPVFFDSAITAATSSRLFSAGAAQRRKHAHLIAYTAQNWLWVHNRIRWLTHYLVVCRDQYWKRDARDDGAIRGQFIDAHIFDLKGFHNGREWDYLGSITVFAHHVWRYYDTYAGVDPINGMIQIKTKKKQYVFDATGTEGSRIYKQGEGEQDAAPPPGGVEFTGKPEQDAQLLNDLIEHGAPATLAARVQRELARRGNR